MCQAIKERKTKPELKGEKISGKGKKKTERKETEKGNEEEVQILRRPVLLTMSTSRYALPVSRRA